MSDARVWGVFDVRMGKWLGEDDCLYAVADPYSARRTAAIQSSLKNRPYEARMLPGHLRSVDQ